MLNRNLSHIIWISVIADSVLAAFSSHTIHNRIFYCNFVTVYRKRKVYILSKTKYGTSCRYKFGLPTDLEIFKKDFLTSNIHGNHFDSLLSDLHYCTNNSIVSLQDYDLIYISRIFINDHQKNNTGLKLQLECSSCQDRE